LAASNGRLYYAVATGLNIWSVSLLPDGSFGNDARFEVTVPRGASPGSEVSEILFDDNGDLLTAERGAPTGAYDYNALAAAGENRVLRFRPKLPSDPPSRDLWFPVPKEYAIGFPPDYRNDNGGIAIGYGYDAAGNINRAVCGGTLWSTGEQLRNARDPAIVRRLQPGGPPIVNGLQGNATRLLRPLNEPPFETYFIDYDDRFDDPPARGHLGDVVIWRVCGGAALPVLPLAVPIICPVGWFNVGGICRTGLACPAGTEFAGGCCTYRGCPASYVRIGGRCVPPPMNCNSDETYSEGRCQAPRCPPGMVVAERKGSGGAGRSSTSGGCGPGEVFNNSTESCEPVPGGGPKMCSTSTYCKCPEGSRVSEDGTCTQSSCGPHMVEGDGTCLCQDGYQGIVDSNGQRICIPNSQCDQSPAQCCPANWHWSRESHTCEPDNAGKPDLKIIKLKERCTQGGAQVCTFTIQIINVGNAPYTGLVEFGDVLMPGSLSAFSGTAALTCLPPYPAGGIPFGSATPPGGAPAGSTVVECGNQNVTIQPNERMVLFFSGVISVADGIKWKNCAQLFPVDENSTNDLSCVNGGDNPQPLCPPDAFPIGDGTCVQAVRTPPPPPSGCAGGAQRNSDGNCPTPPTPSGCPGGVPRDSEGYCPPPPLQLGCLPGTVPTNDGTSCSSGGNPPACQRPKIMSDGVCVCPAGTEGSDCHKTSACGDNQHMEDNECVTNKSKKPRRRHKKPSEPTPSTTRTPPIELNIGIGIGGGGGHGTGSHGPPQRMRPSRGG
jgi:hypothetical protein